MSLECDFGRTVRRLTVAAVASAGESVWLPSGQYGAAKKAVVESKIAPVGGADDGKLHRRRRTLMAWWLHDK